MKKGWEYKKLGDIANDMYRGSGIKREQVTDTGIPCVRYGEIYTTYNIAFDKCASHTNEEIISSPKYFETGDILFAITGESVEEIGKSIAYLGKEKCMCGGDIVVMKHSQYPKYLSYALSSPKAIKQKGLGKTKLKVVHTNIPSLKEISIPVPPLSEQKEIVEYLDSSFAKIDKLKENAAKNLEEAKALFQSALKDALEPKEGWEENKLQEVALDFSRGKSKHRPRNDKRLFGGQYPFIQTGEIRNANVYVTSHSSTYNEMGLSQSKLWPEDTVCITIAANIAEVAILKYPCCFPDSVIGFVADRNKVDKKFVYFSLLNYQQELKKQGKGSAQDNINLGTFEKNTFPFPPLSEQQSIVSFLDSLNEKVNTLQQNYSHICDECDALKQAILRQVFE